MLGKRSRMRRTSSVSLIGSGSVIGDGCPLPELPKEGQKSTSTPRQVIGFHPKVVVDEDLVPPAVPVYFNPPHRTSPNGSPRSGLGDLLANARPWDRKDGVGLGIVAALSSSQEDVRKMAEEIGGYPIPAGHGKKTSPQVTFLPSVFVSPRASPPIPIIPHPNSGHQCSARCNHQNCAAAFGVSSSRPEMMFIETSGRASRPNNSNANTSWLRSNPYNGIAPVQSWGLHSDMEVDRSEPQLLAALPHSSRANILATPTMGFVPNFLDACHLCRRRLGEGSDIYIYRGDKAFCSPECRHQQIVNDERPEKCSSAVMKMGGSDVRTSSQRNRVMAAGTAAAA